MVCMYVCVYQFNWLTFDSAITLALELSRTEKGLTTCLFVVEVCQNITSEHHILIRI